MTTNLLLAAACLMSANVFAGPAKILATYSDDQRVAIALDAKGTPRVDGDANTYPTIKDFREDTDFSDACHVGAKNDVKKLLEALVESANGDGDSWAELVSLKANSKGTYTVVTLITDESGELEESYEFAPCKK